MYSEKPEWIAEQRRRWLRPDAERWMRPDAERYLKPEPFDHKAFISEYLTAQARKAEAAGLGSRTDPVDAPEVHRLLAERRHLVARSRLRRKYRPDQPRVPAGSPDGGQWTSEGGGGSALSDGSPSPPGRVDISPLNRLVRDDSGEESWRWHLDEYRPDGSLERQTIANRDGSTIQSLFAESALAAGWDERHQVMLPDGGVTTFENAGAIQTVYGGAGNQLQQTVWTPNGSEPTAPVHLAQAPVPQIMQLGRAAFERASRAAFALYGWLSRWNTPDSTAVVEFRAREFVFDPSNARSIPEVRALTQQETDVLCSRLSFMQSEMDKAAQTVRSTIPYHGPADFGTKVHKLIEVAVNGEGDRNFRTEVSVLKTVEADAEKRNPADEPDRSLHAKLGTIRYDAYQFVPESRTLCTYDPKTGERNRLWLPRMTELALTGYRNFGSIDRIVVVEVRESKGNVSKSYR